MRDYWCFSSLGIQLSILDEKILGPVGTSSDLACRITAVKNAVAIQLGITEVDDKKNEWKYPLQCIPLQI
jgi:hypothetical protein